MGWGVKRWGSEYCAERFEIVERNACFNEVLLRCFDCFFDDRFVRLALHKVSLSFSGPLSGTTAELDIASHEHAGLTVSVGINELFIRGCQKSGGSVSQSQTADVRPMTGCVEDLIIIDKGQSMDPSSLALIRRVLVLFAKTPANTRSYVRRPKSHLIKCSPL
jgi:hypothetical protein